MKSRTIFSAINLKRDIYFIFFFLGLISSFGQEMINNGVLTISGEETIVSVKNLTNSPTASIKVNGKLIIHEDLTNLGIFGFDNATNSWLQFSGETNQSLHSNNTIEIGNLGIGINSNVGVHDVFLNISDSLKIAVNANLRLIGNSQLKQNHSGDSKVLALGKLHKDVKGTTTNVHQSSYWSSPVTSIGENTFTISNVLKDGTTPLSLSSLTKNIFFTNPSVNNGDGSSDPIKISGRWLAKLENALDWKRQINPATEIFNPTIGWTMKSTGGVNGSSTQNYTFVGAPNDGNYSSTIDDVRLSLVGNPYPSAIDATTFINDNINAISGTLYFYDGASDDTHQRGSYKGGYASYNGLVGVPYGNGTTPKKHIPIGQAFFVYRDVANNGGTGTVGSSGNIIFSNTQRVLKDRYSESAFFGKEKRPTTVIRLGVDFKINDDRKYHRQVAVVFKEGFSTSVENGFDSPMFGINPSDVAFQVKESQEPYSIITQGTYKQQEEIPFSVYLDDNREVTFMIDGIENFESNIFLLDKETNSQYNLTNQSKTLNISKGTYHNRFSLIFKSSQVLSVDDEIKASNITAYFDAKTKELVIKNPHLKLLKELNIFNYLGQQVSKKSIFSTEKEVRIFVGNISKAVYIFNFSFPEGKEIKKIAIH